MVKFPDLPDLSIPNTDGDSGRLVQFITVLTRYLRRALISASGTGAGIMTDAIARGQWCMGTGTNYELALGTPGSRVMGVRVDRGTVAVGGHIKLKCAGEADCRVNDNDTPKNNDCIWTDPVIDGFFTTDPQPTTPVGLVLSSDEHGTNGLCHCLVNMPLCPSFE